MKGLFAIVGLSVAMGKAGAADAPPNIVVVIVDDMGYGDVQRHGNPVVRTPHIDAFAAESVRFTDFHVSPTCSPTRAALMTGRHEFRSGVTHTYMERERLSLQATTIAQLLQQAGYRTGLFGKWHLGDEAPYQPSRRGFDETFIHGAGGIGQTFPGSCGDAPGNSYFDPAILHNGRFEKTQGYCTDVFFGAAADWIDVQRQGDAPFFAWIAPNAPHDPLHCPEEYERRYRGAVSSDLAKFFGMIENIDDNFGALLSKLDSWSIAQNTLVVFLTDNGSATGAEFFNAGMRGRKGTPYNGGTRVPSFWRLPGRFRGDVEVDRLTGHIDVFSTLAELAGVATPASLQLDGRSLAPLLSDPQADWPDRYLFTHVGRWKRGEATNAKFASCAVLSERFHFVNNRELYDVDADPSESRNVADSHPEVVADMRRAYDQWWSDVLPALVNEDAVGPAINPFKALYWAQFGGGPNADGASWRKHVVHQGFPTMTAVAADFTGDGRPDVICNSAGKTRLLAAPQWTETVLDENPEHDFIHSEHYDVDGDGDNDYIGARYDPGLIVWLERPADPGSLLWPLRIIDDQIHGIHGVIKGDVDGDGALDLLATSAQPREPFPNSLAWFSTPSAPHAANRWPRTIFAVADAPGLTHYLGFGDVNGDGRPDAATGAKGGPTAEPGTGDWFAWWEAPANPHGVWQKHVIAREQPGATNIHPTDVDGDGRVDFVVSRGHGNGVAWFRAPDWELREIDATIQEPHCLAAADLDADGDVDVATCAFGDKMAVWYENGGKGEFAKHVIDRNQEAYDIRAVDMDVDGDLDLLVAGRNSNNVVWYENPHVGANAASRE